jgi:type II secretory pathway predicted ATPase ExeA
MLLHVLREWLRKRNYIMALCTNPTLTREEFYDLLMAEMEIACGSDRKSRQLRALEDHLLHNAAAGRRTLLIVDEAHAMLPALMEEIRLLLNLETAHEKLLNIVIADRQSCPACCAEGISGKSSKG